jgi:hypothetical protein
MVLVSPFDRFDDIRCINLDSAGERWRDMEQRFRKLGIGGRVRRFPAVATPANHRIGRALSHRRVVQEAVERGCRSVLVFEDDTLFLEDTLAVLAAADVELARCDWQLCYLGGCLGECALEPEPGCRHLARVRGVAHTYAVAYSERIYPRLLQDWPADPEVMRDWIGKQRSASRYLQGVEHSVAVRPPVASRPRLLPFEEPADQFRFTL